MNRTKRNRFFAIAISMVLAICLLGGVLAACGKKKESDDVTLDNDNEEEQVIEKTAMGEVKYSYTPEPGTGKTYYVSADVAQFTSTSDGSYSNPYNILDLVGWGSSGSHSSTSILEPGDTVLVIPGEYNLMTSVYVEKSGTYDNYITIMNAAYANDGHTYESTTATMSLYGESFNGNNRGVTINSNYIYWYGIDVAGAGDNGMYIGGSHNVIENSQFYNNRDTGLQLGRADGGYTNISQWPSYNLIKNCTSFNNYDNETYGENADGFGAKLTIGYGNMFDGCIAYRNSDDGWDLYAKEDTGNIGCVILYNCVAFENGYLLDTQAECNARFTSFDNSKAESDTNKYTTRDGDGNGFKLGGGSNEGDVKLYNCMSFNNRMHGVTDNSNPGTLQLDSVTSYNNGAAIDDTPQTATGDDGATIYLAPSGKVDYSGGTESSSCANIDVSRQTYSYNTLANILSIIDGNSKTAGDAYRGAVTNSLFASSSSLGHYVEGTIDADTKNDGGLVGKEYTPASASSIFVETPSLDLGIRTSFDEKGIVNSGDGNIHEELRLEDGTINTGDMLKIKEDADLQLGGVGADLDKSSWGEYIHYDYTVGTSTESAEDDEIIAIYNMVYVPVDENAVYQNFKVVNSILGSDIKWTSSDSDVLTVTDNVTYTTSQSSSVDVIVNRDPTADHVVTLTASFETTYKYASKDFVLTIKKDLPSVGNILVEGVENDEIIVDQGADMTEPAVTVENGADYSGKLLTDDLYTIQRTYQFAETASGTYDTVESFSTETAGVYKITLKVSITNPESGAKATEGEYTYTIYVASTSSEVAFMDNKMTLTINRDGFQVSGDLSSPTGFAYVLRSESGLTGTGSGGGVRASQVIDDQNVIKTEFRQSSIALNFDDPNTAGYYVYCVLTSIDGSKVSQVYSAQAKQQNITSTTEFVNVLGNNSTDTMYLLTADLDFTDETYTTPSGNFVGLLNGMGHTIKNITVSGTETNTGVIGTVKGGTIENVKFENISITSTTDQTGIIGTMEGGYLYNIAATNISVSGNNKIGGIIGRIYASSSNWGATTYISCVSLVNEYTHELGTDSETGNTIVSSTGAVIAGNERIGGIAGTVEASSSSGWTVAYISDCYVNAYITCNNGIASGIVGRWYDRHSSDYLEISYCYVTGILESTRSDKNYLGGMVGQIDGSGTTRISYCLSLGEIWYNNESLSASLKNASWIVGNYAENGDIIVTRCYAMREEYNDAYGVTAEVAVLDRYSSISRYIYLDTEYWSYVFDTSSADNGDGTYYNLLEPYIVLEFQGDWD